MDIDLRVDGLTALRERIEDAVERDERSSGGTRIASEAFVSRPFMRRHTQFESFDRFREASPREDEEFDGLRRHGAGELDEFVTATTEFESWEEMQRTAAAEDIVSRARA